MRWIALFLILGLNSSLFAKEWKNLRVYQKETGQTSLPLSDWLKRDRRKHTIVWQNANAYNLKHNLPEAYQSIAQRRDFYKWFFKDLEAKGHEVVWVKMAHFISKKMNLMEVFPYCIFSRKPVKVYAREGSVTVFNNAFIELQKLYESSVLLKGEDALEWDKEILKKEQHNWIDSIYKTMNTKSLKTLKRIAGGTFLYGLLVPKGIRFKDDLSDARTRYIYAIEVLKPYCENRYK